MKDIHTAATRHLPGFITAPGETDTLLWLAGIVLVGAVLMVGVLFFWLHSLPERVAHKRHKHQMELIAILCLLSLFTHIHTFWVIALILAFVKIPERLFPDFSSPLRRIAASLEKLTPGVPAGAPDATALTSANPVLAVPQITSGKPETDRS